MHSIRKLSGAKIGTTVMEDDLWTGEAIEVELLELTVEVGCGVV